MVSKSSAMAKKVLSVIIVPHTKTSTRTFAFTRRSLRAVVVGGSVFALLLVAFLADYFSVGLIRQKYRALSRESAQQQVRIAEYEKSISRLEATIANFESYAKKLNIMAGLKSADVLTAPAGVGGGPGPGEAEAQAGPMSYAAPQTLSQSSIQSLSRKAENVESNLNNLVGFFESQAMRLATTPSIRPTAGWLASSYGMRTDPFTGQYQMHWGIDISTNTGNPIVATADGIVIKVQTDKYLGRNVTISHGNGVTTVYGHMNAFACKAGQKVKRGDVIGYVGMTGKAVGPHVHYEVRKDGRPVNPFNYILED